MAKSKNSFILYTEYAEQLELLTMEERGVLMTALFNYKLGEELPKMSGAVRMCFAFIKQQFERDNEKYDDICKARVEAGKAGAAKRWQNEQTIANDSKNSKSQENIANDSKRKKNIAKIADNDNDNDNENENDNDNDNEDVVIKGDYKGGNDRRFQPPTVEEVQAYCEERRNVVDAQRFVDFYTSNGWKVGKNPMKDWKAAVRTWEREARNSRRRSHSTDEDDPIGQVNRLIAKYEEEERLNEIEQS